jgi:tol-pal system protein YbgF
MTKTLMCAAAVLAMTAAPALAQSRADRQMMADIRMLQEQAQQLAITLATLTDSIKSLNARMDKSDEATRKGLADQRLVVENLGSDVRVIRERTDETNVRINTLSQEMEALRNSLAQMAAAAQTAQIPVDPNAPIDPNAPPAIPAPGAPSTVGLSPTRMYETAFADYAAGQWTLAISGFEQFLKTFPKSEMADEAQYHIGETHYLSGKYADAIAAYNLVIQSYPASDKAAMAYVKRGLAQERSNQPDAARASWEYVIKTYPAETDAARMAKQNLDRLGNKKPGAP